MLASDQPAFKQNTRVGGRPGGAPMPSRIMREMPRPRCPPFPPLRIVLLSARSGIYWSLSHLEASRFEKINAATSVGGVIPGVDRSRVWRVDFSDGTITAEHVAFENRVRCVR